MRLGCKSARMHESPHFNARIALQTARHNEALLKNKNRMQCGERFVIPNNEPIRDFTLGTIACMIEWLATPRAVARHDCRSVAPHCETRVARRASQRTPDFRLVNARSTSFLPQRCRAQIPYKGHRRSSCAAQTGSPEARRSTLSKTPAVTHVERGVRRGRGPQQARGRLVVQRSRRFGRDGQLSFRRPAAHSRDL